MQSSTVFERTPNFVEKKSTHAKSHAHFQSDILAISSDERSSDQKVAECKKCEMQDNREMQKNRRISSPRQIPLKKIDARQNRMPIFMQKKKRNRRESRNEKKSPHFDFFLFLLKTNAKFYCFCTIALMVTSQK